MQAFVSNNRLLLYQILMFSLTYLAYLAFYLPRNSLSVVKSKLNDDLKISLGSLGAIDTAYLTTYAIGQFIAGWAVDRFYSRRTVSIGLLFAALTSVGFGAVGFFGLEPTVLVGLMGLFWAINGFAQSTGWCSCSRILSVWFTITTRGKIVGLWSTCYQLGALIGTILATYFMQHLGWQWAFVIPGIMVFGLLIPIFLLMRDSPSDVDLEVEEPAVGGIVETDLNSATDSETRLITDSERSEEDPLTKDQFLDELIPQKPQTFKDKFYFFFEALTLPGISNLCAAYFCIKIIRYSLLFWLPFYLHKTLKYDEDIAGYMSTSVQVGGILGVLGAGALSDLVPGRRVYVIAPFNLLTALSLAVFIVASRWGWIPNVFFLGASGFFLYAADSLVAGSAAQDLGGKDMVGRVVGMVNGVGSVGAALQGWNYVFYFLSLFVGVIVPAIADVGWNYVFYFLIGMSILSYLVVLPTVYQKFCQLDHPRIN